MESISVLKIRLTGIIGCISDYTSQPTITAIISSLESAIGENDFEIILFASKEIDKWYGKEMNKILSNQYVYNKREQQESWETIKQIINELEEYSNEYRAAFSELSKPSSVGTVKVDGLLNLLDRFHQVVIQLRDRYQNRETLDVNDEYDVQDLIHSLLRIYCDDIRPEEWTPSYAGTCSRQDFLLKKENIVIEIKKTRKGLGNRELADQLIIDIARYKEHPDCKTLICFVYDPENRIKNPRGFENDLSKRTDMLNIVVSIRP